MSEEIKRGTKEYWRQKYKAAISPLKKVSMERKCLKCDKPFRAWGVPDGVKYIRICLTCKHSSKKMADNDRKMGYV